jgi:hypothetical protein
MSLNPLAKKLAIKPHMRMRIVAAPDGYIESLAPLPNGAHITSAEDGQFAFVQLFATTAAALKQPAQQLLRDAGEKTVVWVAYPKLGSRLAGELSRDRVRAILSDLGWRAVSIVAIDEVWSALRFRPLAQSSGTSEGPQEALR